MWHQRESKMQSRTGPKIGTHPTHTPGQPQEKGNGQKTNTDDSATSQSPQNTQKPTTITKRIRRSWKKPHRAVPDGYGMSCRYFNTPDMPNATNTLAMTVMALKGSG